MNNIFNNISRNINYLINQVNDRVQTAVVNFHQYVNPNNQENNGILYPDPYIIHRQPLRIARRNGPMITSAHLAAWTPAGRESLDFLTNDDSFNADERREIFLMTQILENLMNSDKLILDRENVKKSFLYSC